jgi:hypothetical protein
VRRFMAADNSHEHEASSTGINPYMFSRRKIDGRNTSDVIVMTIEKAHTAEVSAKPSDVVCPQSSTVYKSVSRWRAGNAIWTVRCIMPRLDDGGEVQLIISVSLRDGGEFIYQQMSIKKCQILRHDSEG